MPLSRQDAARALSLLEDFMGKLDDENEREHVEALQRAIEVIRSSLFASLIDIQQSYVEDVSCFDSSWSVPESDALDFCRRYGVSLESVRNSRRGSKMSENGNGEESVAWEADPVLAKAQALLDEGQDVVRPLGGAPKSFLDELTSKTSERRSSLDEMALKGEAETSFSVIGGAGSRADKYKVTTGNGEVSGKGSDVGSRHDSLVFMRSKQSMNRFEQSAESRAQRVVSLTKGAEGLGMSIVGTATTGVFISMLVAGGYAERDSRVRKGDQILSINGTTMENKSYTDAASIIKQIPSGGNCEFTLTSNPAVFAEYERVASQRAK